jgi:hypothetical protein
MNLFRRRERERVREILTSPDGEANQTVARAIVLHTSVPADEAIALLKALGPDRSLFGRMQRLTHESDPAKDRVTRQSAALAIVNAGRKARGEEPLPGPGKEDR